MIRQYKCSHIRNWTESLTCHIQFLGSFLSATSREAFFAVSIIYKSQTRFSFCGDQLAIIWNELVQSHLKADTIFSESDSSQKTLWGFSKMKYTYFDLLAIEIYMTRLVQCHAVLIFLRVWVHVALEMLELVELFLTSLRPYLSWPLTEVSSNVYCEFICEENEFLPGYFFWSKYIYGTEYV
jgi:hypothetical protein